MTVLELVCSLQYLATKWVLTSGLMLLPSGTLLFHFTVITLGNRLAQHVAFHEKMRAQDEMFHKIGKLFFFVISKQNILIFVFWLIVWFHATYYCYTTTNTTMTTTTTTTTTITTYILQNKCRVPKDLVCKSLLSTQCCAKH